MSKSRLKRVQERCNTIENQMNREFLEDRGYWRTSNNCPKITAVRDGQEVRLQNVFLLCDEDLMEEISENDILENIIALARILLREGLRVKKERKKKK